MYLFSCGEHSSRGRTCETLFGAQRKTLAGPPDGCPESRRIARVRGHRQAPKGHRQAPKRSSRWFATLPSIAGDEHGQQEQEVEFTAPPSHLLGIPENDRNSRRHPHHVAHETAKTREKR